MLLHWKNIRNKNKWGTKKKQDSREKLAHTKVRKVGQVLNENNEIYKKLNMENMKLTKSTVRKTNSYEWKNEGTRKR